MATLIDDAWIGKHPVEVGPSLIRALKARAGESAKPVKTKIPVNDFHSFRYKFKPESIDDTRQGLVEAKTGSDNAFRVERPAFQSDDSHVFSGIERPARDWECVLILDEDTGAFTLEKLDSSMDLTYDGRLASARIPNGSSAAEMDASSAALGDADADGESDLDEVELLSNSLTKPSAQAQQLGSAAEEEERPLADFPSTSSRITPLAAATKDVPANLVKGKGKAKGKANSKTAKPKVKKKVELDSDVDVKIATRTSAQARFSGKAPIPLANVTPRPSEVLRPPPAVRAPQTSAYEVSSMGSELQTDSDDDDMEAVQPTLTPLEEDQDTDADAFARELDQNLMTDDDTPDVDDRPPATSQSVGPVSLNQYAGGAEDEDDYSSSDESD